MLPRISSRASSSIVIALRLWLDDLVECCLARGDCETP